MARSLLVNLSVLIPQPTGISVYATNLLPYLQPLNPTLLASHAICNYPYYPVPDNMTPQQGTQGHLRRILWTQFKLPQIYRQLRSQLLFSPLPEAPLFSGCRYIVTAHDLIPLRFPQRFSRLTAYFRYFIPQVLSQAEQIICDSRSTANDITEFFKIPEKKMSVVPLAYNAERFRFLDLPTRNYFLYIGRHDRYKNVHRSIAAFATLSNREDYEFWIAGPSDRLYTPTLKAQVVELGLENQVKFLDYVPAAELPTVINQAIALVFPSLWEGFGFPVLEAMGCGTPVITSRLSSVPEVGGEAVLYVNPYEVGEIAEAMQTLARDGQLRMHLRALGLAQASQFSWEKTGKATVAILERYI